MNTDLRDKIKIRKSRNRKFAIGVGIIGITILLIIYCAGIEKLLRPPTLMMLSDVFKAKTKIESTKNIYFLKKGNLTSTKMFISSKLLLWSEIIRFPEARLTSQEACAVESAALHNPRMEVFVIFINQSKWINTTDPMIGALQSYPNVQFRVLNLRKYTHLNPLRKLNHTERFWLRMESIKDHLMDFLPFLTLWRWGGTYLDFDTMVLRDLDELGHNYVVANEKANYITPKIVNFSPTGIGRLFITEYLLSFAENMNNMTQNDNLSEEILLNITKRFSCNKTISGMIEHTNFFGLKVYGTKQFQNFEFPTATQDNHDLSKQFRDQKNLYAIYSRNTSQSKSTENSITYGLRSILAKNNCPKVFRTVNALGP